MNKNMINIRVTTNSTPDKIHLEINCKNCGEPITKTSVRYGMDCVNDCNKKEIQKFRKNPQNKQLKKFWDQFLK